MNFSFIWEVNVCLKWETEMMMNRLRAAVIREMDESPTFRSTVLDQWSVGFLQELFSSSGKQSSASGCIWISIIRFLQLSNQNFLSYNKFISFYHTSRLLLCSLENDILPLFVHTTSCTFHFWFLRLPSKHIYHN